jgi:small GTP-binding protein
MKRITKFDYHVLITGFFNAGKTTLIHSLDPGAISIEKALSDFTKKKLNIESHSQKTHTTTGFDRGCLFWLRNSQEGNGILMSYEEYKRDHEEFKDWIVKFVELKGVPGQAQFKIVRKLLSKGAEGVVFLFDGADLTNIGNGLAILEETRVYMPNQPMVIVANKKDHANYYGAETVSSMTGESDIYEASALENIGIKDAIINLLKTIEQGKGITVPIENCAVITGDGLSV